MKNVACSKTSKRVAWLESDLSSCCLCRPLAKYGSSQTSPVECRAAQYRTSQGNATFYYMANLLKYSRVRRERVESQQREDRHVRKVKDCMGIKVISLATSFFPRPSRPLRHIHTPPQSSRCCPSSSYKGRSKRKVRKAKEIVVDACKLCGQWWSVLAHPYPKSKTPRFPNGRQVRLSITADA